jgi:hypothetical protein
MDFLQSESDMVQVFKVLYLVSLAKLSHSKS